MAKNVVYVYCEEDRTRTCWVLSSVLLKFSISYLGSRKMGTVLAHVGHDAYPCGARCLPQVGTTSIQNVPKAVQRRNARKGDEKRSKSL